MSENEVKEVEVLSEKKDDEVRKTKPKKPKSEHTKAIRFWTRFTSICFRWSVPGLFLGLAAGLCFLILKSQGTLVDVSTISMWIGFALAICFAIMLILGFIGNAFLKHYCEDDPNYQGD